MTPRLTDSANRPHGYPVHAGGKSPSSGRYSVVNSESVSTIKNTSLKKTGTDQNGDKLSLIIVCQPGVGRLSGLSSAPNSAQATYTVKPRFYRYRNFYF